MSLVILLFAIKFYMQNPRGLGLFLTQVTGKGGPNCTLVYFKARGRAEPIRMALEIAGWSYKEELFTKEQWTGGIKEAGTASGLFHFSQVPQLSIQWAPNDVVKLTQSHTILRYIARHTNLYGTHPDHQAKIDLLADGAADLRGAFKKIQYGPSFEHCSGPALLSRLPRPLLSSRF